MPTAQHDLSVSLNSVGDALVAQGNLAEALRTYQSRHAVLDRLAKLDPGNDMRQYELAISYGKLANTYRRLRQTIRIRENLNAGRGILARLVAQHPEEEPSGNATWPTLTGRSPLNVAKPLSAARVASWSSRPARPRAALMQNPLRLPLRREARRP